MATPVAAAVAQATASVRGPASGVASASKDSLRSTAPMRSSNGDRKKGGGDEPSGIGKHGGGGDTNTDSGDGVVGHSGRRDTTAGGGDWKALEASGRRRIMGKRTVLLWRNRTTILSIC